MESPPTDSDSDSEGEGEGEGAGGAGDAQRPQQAAAPPSAPNTTTQSRNPTVTFSGAAQLEDLGASTERCVLPTATEFRFRKYCEDMEKRRAEKKAKESAAAASAEAAQQRPDQKREEQPQQAAARLRGSRKGKVRFAEGTKTWSR